MHQPSIFYIQRFTTSINTAFAGGWKSYITYALRRSTSLILHGLQSAARKALYFIGSWVTICVNRPEGVVTDSFGNDNRLCCRAIKVLKDDEKRHK
jgi:hypothetical protein